MEKTSNIYIKIGQRLTELRKAAKMSQEQLALQAGVERTYVGKIERGVRHPSIDTLSKIAETLNVELYKLFISKTVESREHHS